ncbi:MAG: hypothetical protein EAZ37_08225 [Burkholderiales bacterium]|nr:MAG: hypothetical protein EAZ37_08225 [Burkholderiales bacterium]
MVFKERFLSGVQAGFIHLLVSVLVASLLAFLVFGWWYPYPLREMVGGTELFLLVIAVDVICGPLLTAVIFSPAKKKWQLLLDVAIVVVIQLVALIYGTYTVVQARPIYVVFEVDRFRVVTLADVDHKDWNKASPPWTEKPWGTPRWITIREPIDNAEKLESIELAIAGKDAALRPNWWNEWSADTPEAILSRSKSISDLRKKLDIANLIILDGVLVHLQVSEDRLRSLPMTSFKTTNWVAIIDSQTAKPLAYAPVDGF